MKITLESTNHDVGAIPTAKRTATIEVNYDGMTVDQIIDELIKPVLVAYGFHPKSVEQCLPDDLAGSGPVYELNDEKEEEEEEGE